MAKVVQVFGTRGCAGTRKAIRFFKERRVDHQFVDLKQKAMSRGELKRFAQKHGADALIDREGKRYRNKGLHAAHPTGERILAILEDDPTLLKTPLVRVDNQVGIGVDEDAWAEWI